jgi:CheY-like chemotaxis protein
MISSLRPDDAWLSPGRSDDRRPQRPHVLIIDDDEIGREICAGYLDLFDCTSHTVGSGAEAVAALRREAFSLVLLNVHMRRCGALDTLRAMRALPEGQGAAPVIGLMGFGRGDEAQRWLGAGLAGALAKPITAARLHLALASAAERETRCERSWAAVR